MKRIKNTRRSRTPVSEGCDAQIPGRSCYLPSLQHGVLICCTESHGLGGAEEKRRRGAEEEQRKRSSGGTEEQRRRRGEEEQRRLRGTEEATGSRDH